MFVLKRKVKKNNNNNKKCEKMLMTSVMTSFYTKNLRNPQKASKHTLLSRKDARSLKLSQNMSFTNRIHLH